jgi:hypothetical protein
MTKTTIPPTLHRHPSDNDCPRLPSRQHEAVVAALTAKGWTLNWIGPFNGHLQFYDDKHSLVTVILSTE